MAMAAYDVEDTPDPLQGNEFAADGSLPNDAKSLSTTKNIPKRVALYGGGAVLAVGLVTLALPAAGFTAGGVAAGSLAASIQSAGLAGPAFAALQSAGAAGLSLSTQALIGITGAGIAGTVDKLTENESKKAQKKELKEWITNQVQLPEYYELLLEHGFDSLQFVIMIEEKDLVAMGITKIGHRKQFLRNIMILKQK